MKNIIATLLNICIICSKIELICCIIGLAALATGMPPTATVTAERLAAVALVDAVTIFSFTWLRGLLVTEEEA